MKPYPEYRFTLRLLSLSLMLAAGLALPLPALAGSVALATSPLATSTTSTVKPNLMFVLDDSGSMDWDYMPDNARNFAGRYGFNSSQCNGTYYNPAITYAAPINSTGAALNATPTSFTAAYKDGFNTGAGTVDLSTGFRGGSGSGSSGISLTAGPAFYYTYSGTQTAAAQKDIHNTNSVFYKECNSAVGSTTAVDGTHAVNTLFSKVRLAATPTTTITVSGAGGTTGATITITSISTRSKVSNIKVNGAEILTGITSRSSSASTVATNIAAGINACTTSLNGNCTVTGYSATSSSNVVTIIGPGAAAGFSPIVTRDSGDMVWTTTAFPTVTATTVSSITVNGSQLLSASATGTNTSNLASDISSKITQNGYSASVSNNIVTVTGPASASTYTPVISVASGTMTLTTEAFPESTAAKLQNFANWYSYYSNRMLMMKTAAGLAFQPISDSYRVGFLTMNNNVSPGIVEAAPFNAAQKSAWYTKLYASNPGSSTPLREALAHVGQYYAHKFGTITTYTATITVGGSGSTIVDSITVNGTETMADSSAASTSTSTVASNIANQINAVNVTAYGAHASGNVVSISGPASAAGSSPVISKNGDMTFSSTTFTASTSTANLNGISPADPMQFSCQQNFTILSTDGYWNGSTTYDLANSTVGQQDGTAARPMNDGAQAGTITTVTYSRNYYSRQYNGCSSGRVIRTQPQRGTCTVTGSGNCTPTNWIDDGAYTEESTSNCRSITSSGVPSPSVPVETGRVTTTGAIGGTSDTLADVAMYYYQTDLRTPELGNCTGAGGADVCQNNVFVSGNDNNLQQHMTTFTLGLGARGRMVYSTSYQNDTTGDFVAVKQGSTASSSVCTWQTAGTVCNWPTPSSGAIQNIDDLWHAAVNGRGAYFNATDPTSLSAGLTNALTTINSKIGSAAAAATSTLNPVAGNNFAYVASYTTISWKGNLEARGINVDTGVVSENASWCVENVAAQSCAAPGTIVPDSSGATTVYNCVKPDSVICPGGVLDGTDCKVPVATACTGTLQSKVSDITDTRTIKTANSAGTALTNFDDAYAAANPGYFDAARISGLSQWPASATPTAEETAWKTNAAGVNLLRYLRGQNGHEYDRTGVLVPDQLYRNRESVLGDALESQPAYIGAPVFSYPYPGYSEFLTAQSSRAGTVYMGTNDGMMHAFDASNGTERWAYVPSMVIPDLWKLADKTYSNKHSNYVNGSAITSDVCTARCNSGDVGWVANWASTATTDDDPVWKTILVAGLNGGGRGYYALDITNPSAPALLWEFTTTTGIGKVKDNDLGYTYGQPIITTKGDGTWVVLLASGYDNGTDSAQLTDPACTSSCSFVANSPAGSGNGYLYVLNAGTGTMISKIATGTVGTAAAPNGLAKISGWNTETSGNKVSYVYGGDLLGNLWRFDINSSDTAAYGTGIAFKLASLYADGTTANTAGTSPQPVTTTPILGNIVGKRVVFIGTGKYLERGDLTTTQKQTQYAIKDDDATATLVNPRTTLVNQTLTNNPDGTATRLSSGNTVNFFDGRGWYVDFPDTGERVNIDAKLVQGTLLVPTIVPSNTVCSPGGFGWLNFFDYKTGGSVTPTPGIPLASVKYDSTIVGINVLYIQGVPIVEVVTSTNPTPKKDPDVTFKASAVGFTGKRVIWRELVP